MRLPRLSIVSYLNSKPFLEGISRGLKDELEISLDIPSVCAQKIINGEADIGLIPVAVLPLISSDYRIISDYCIGAKGKVESVSLFSQVPLNEIEEILLDYQSRTSVELLQILCREYWHLKVIFTATNENYISEIGGTKAGVIIGDRALMLRERFKYNYDLAEAWYTMTGLPFVFAIWVGNKHVDAVFEARFNYAIKMGLSLIAEISGDRIIGDYPIKKYLTENISYELNEEKQKGLELFLQKLKQPQ